MTKTFEVAETLFAYAKEFVEMGRELSPMFLLCGRDGPPQVLSTPWRNTYEKCVAVDMVRGILARDLNIDGYVSISEAWMAQADPSEADPCAIPASKRDNKIEVILIAIGERNGRVTMWHAEIKSENGKRSVGERKTFGEKVGESLAGNQACLFPAPKGSVQ